MTTSRGSYGHPELCAAPCIRAFYSRCTKGFLCDFCHIAHTKPKCKLNRAERHFFDSLDEAQVLSLVLSLLRQKSAKLPGTQQDVLRLLLAAIQSRVKSLREPEISRDTRFGLTLIWKFSLGRLFEVIQQFQQVNANLKMQLKSLLMSARTAVHHT